MTTNFDIFGTFYDNKYACTISSISDMFFISILFWFACLSSIYLAHSICEDVLVHSRAENSNLILANHVFNFFWFYILFHSFCQTGIIPFFLFMSINNIDQSKHGIRSLHYYAYSQLTILGQLPKWSSKKKKKKHQNNEILNVWNPSFQSYE